MNKQKEKSAWQKIRKFLNDVHLWMGIGSGIILFIVCLTGTIYTFSTEIQERLEPEKFWVQAPANAQMLSAEAIGAKVLDSLKGYKLTAFNIPLDKSRSWQVTVKKEEKKEAGREGKQAGIRSEHVENNKTSIGDKQTANLKPTQGNKASFEVKNEGKNSGGQEGKLAEIAVGNGDDKKGLGPGSKRPTGPEAANGGRVDRGITYLVNPYTGEILGGTKGAGSEFFMTIFKLHRWLLLDTEIGRPIVGWATVLFALLCISGLVIWVPQKARMWKQGLKLKLTRNWKRNNHDLHNTLGFYAVIPLLVMALTGLTWSFEWYNNGFRKLMGTYKPKDAPREKPVQSSVPFTGSTKPLLVVDYMHVADSILPYNGDYRVGLAESEKGAVSISKTRQGFFAPAAGDRLQLDQYTAAALTVDIFKNKSFGERVSGSVKALHVGNVYGTFSKIIYFICCLIATSLPVTGTIIWINKLKKKRRRSANQTRAKTESESPSLLKIKGNITAKL